MRQTNLPPNDSSTWILHLHSQPDRWSWPLVGAVRHATLVSSSFPFGCSVDDETVVVLPLCLAHSQLVALLVSRPADDTIGVHPQDAIRGGSITLKAPRHCYWYLYFFDPAHQVHVFSYSHKALTTLKVDRDRRLYKMKREGLVITEI